MLPRIIKYLRKRREIKKMLQEIKSRINYIVNEMRMDRDDGYGRRQVLLEYYASLSAEEKEICDRYICNTLEKTDGTSLWAYLLDLCADAKIHNLAPCLEEIYRSKKFLSNILREGLLYTMLYIGHKPAIDLAKEFLEEVKDDSEWDTYETVLTATTAHAEEKAFINLSTQFWINLLSSEEGKYAEGVAGTFIIHIFESNPSLLKKLVGSVYNSSQKLGKELAQACLNDINKFKNMHEKEIGVEFVKQIKDYLEKFLSIDEGQDA